MVLSLNPRVRMVWLTVLAMIATLWLSSAAAVAGSSEVWSITNMSGRVNIVRSGAAPVALTTGDELRPGDMIETAADSSAVLVRNGESIVVAPNSRMGLPSTNDSGFATLILQQFGTLLLKVEKQQQRHFEVKTPYLAAVVKGTTFTVNVDTAGASVHVLEGAVQVANKTGVVALVRPGQTANVSSAPGAGLSIQGDSTKAPAQRSEGKQDQNNAGPGKSAAKSKAADTPSASKSSRAKFKIKKRVGPAEIDIATATNGLLRAARGPDQVADQARKATSGKGVGKKGKTKGAAAAEASGGGVGSTGMKTKGVGKKAKTKSLAAAGNPGGAPVMGSPQGGPAAAGAGGGLPATASLAAQVAASPESQGNNGKSKKKK